MYYRWIIGFVLFFLGGIVTCQEVLDEIFDSWESLPTDFWEDPDDLSESSVDIRRVHMTSDARYIYLYLEVEDELLLQQDNALELYLDLDGSINTGRVFDGLGAELVFEMGMRRGIVYFEEGGSEFVNHWDVGLVVSPTVSSDRFEMVIDRVRLEENFGLPSGLEVRFRWLSDDFPADRAPDVGFYSRAMSNVEEDYGDGIPESEAGEFRVLSYNLLFDNVFESDAARGAFGRHLRALRPDVIAIQEVYDHSALEMANMVEDLYPAGTGSFWYSVRVPPDILLVSRYDIRDAVSIDGNGLFLLDIEGKDLLVANMHLPCCDQDAERQNEIDVFLSELRDIQMGSGALDVVSETPIIVIGDMNLVGDRSVRESLMIGNIANNGAFGADFRPDWGKGDLEMATALVVGFPGSYTWVNPDGSFYAGRLDYAFYSPSGLQLERSLVLDSRRLGTAALVELGLFPFDSPIVSDHMPLVCDFAFSMSTASPTLNEVSQGSIRVITGSDLNVESEGIWEELIVHGPTGVTLLRQERPTFPFHWSASHLPAGLYWVELRSDSHRTLHRWVKL